MKQEERALQHVDSNNNRDRDGDRDVDRDGDRVWGFEGSTCSYRLVPRHMQASISKHLHLLSDRYFSEHETDPILVM